MDAIEVPTDPLRGHYDELVDVAEDLATILDAVADSQLDLTPTLERWLVQQRERIGIALARALDADAA